MPSKRRIVYPGTFDPITLGHLDIIGRALKLFDEVIIAVAENPEKKSFFSLDERVQLVEKSCAHLKRVRVCSFSGLLVDFLREHKCFTIVRGLRELSDFEYEFQQAVLNRKLDSRMDTVFILTDPNYFYLSSSIVREIALLRGPISPFVPKPVERALRAKQSPF